ncbi:hypothetical protein SAMN05660691_00004 [Rheinheimera pacifica]|uniref:HNH endonuclease n=1 Tax=Rheinheimera pacifica TaxID=173990 RepID=A0A1H6J1H7_9GAMM|nr:hypothetical protein SAMN05660691_00004 [Rheinheimera pacifica]
MSIGVAAHICAASPGGPRYNPNMSEEQRTSYDNGIWLCQTCSRLIDVDERRFSVELLQTWKREAEEYSLKRVGQKSITEHERDKEVRAAYGQGVLEQAKGSVIAGDSISKVIEGYEKNLSELDERFLITVDKASASHTIHRIEAKPGYRPTINLLVRNTDSLDSLRRFQEFGESVQLDGDSFKFEGSKLFDILPPGRGSLFFRGKPEKIETYILFRSDRSGDDCELAYFHSNMTSGSKGVSINGSGLSGLFTLKATATQDEGTRLNAKYSIEPWLGKRLDKLAYFPKLLKAKTFLEKHPDARLVIEFHHQGQPIIFDSIKYNHTGFKNGFLESISIIDYCRAIAENFPESLIFKEYAVSDREYEQIKRYYSILKGGSFPVNEGNQFCEGDLDEGMETSIDYWERAGEGWLRCEEGPSENATNVLGNMVVAPPMHAVVHRYSMALFCLLDGKEKGKLSFTINAVKDSTLEWSFDKSRKWFLL